MSHSVETNLSTTIKIEKATRDLLDALDIEAKDGTLDTPRRVAKAWQELLWGMKVDPSACLAKQFAGTADLVMVKNISFYSLCEHHLLPFHGTAAVAYVPSKEYPKVVGLSKLARCVRGYAARLQIQERLTHQIATAIKEKLNAQAAACVISAEHLCMSMRGVEAPNTFTVTSSMLGFWRTNSEARGEVLSLLKGDR